LRGVKVLAVIPARGGSKGIPRKNLKLLAGKPLIAYIIEAALKAKKLDRVIVSTEDKEIAQVARGYGAEVPFLRPLELARDEVSLIPVIKHAMEFMDELGWRADIIASLQPTAPFTQPEDIDAAVRKLVETGCDSVVSVESIERHHPFRAMKLSGDRLSPLTEYASEEYLQKQDRPPAYGFNGAIYVRKRKLLEKWAGKDFALGEDIRAIVMSPEKSVDINSPLDFLIAEALLKHNIKVSQIK